MPGIRSDRYRAGAWPRSSDVRWIHGFNPAARSSPQMRSLSSPSPPRTPAQTGGGICKAARNSSLRALGVPSPGGTRSWSLIQAGNRSQGSALAGRPASHRFKPPARAVQLGASPTGTSQSIGRPTRSAQTRAKAVTSGVSSSEASRSCSSGRFRRRGSIQPHHRMSARRLLAIPSRSLALRISRLPSNASVMAVASRRWSWMIARTTFGAIAAASSAAGATVGRMVGRWLRLRDLLRAQLISVGILEGGSSRRPSAGCGGSDG